MQAVFDHKIFDPDLYQVGGTLSADAPSYIARAADRELYDALQKGEFCYILDSRQVGKSTLIIHAAQRLRSSGVRVATLDFSEPGRAGITEDKWYYALLRQLGEALRLLKELETFWKENASFPPLSRWMEAIKQVALPSHSSPLVIFIDEVDSLLSLPFEADEIFSSIRACYNRRAEHPDLKRLTFCLGGSASPTQLVSNPRVTPFNIGRRIIPTDFTEKEAAKLVKGAEDAPEAKELLHRILYWTGGHPYLTQALCRALADLPSLPTLRDVDRCCETLFFAHEPRESDHLAHVRNRLLHSNEDVASLLDLYARVRANPRAIAYQSTNPLHTALRLSGFVWADDGYLRVRNRIYEHVFNRKWIRDTMPGAELQRQNAAFRRGIIRAGAVACVMGLIALWAISEAHRANTNADRASKKEREARISTQQAQAAQLQATQAAQSSEIAKHKANLSAQAEKQSAQTARTALEKKTSAEKTALAAAKRERRATRREHDAKVDAQNKTILANRKTEEVQSLLYATNMNAIPAQWEAGNVQQVLNLLDQTRNYKDRGFEWGYWNHLCHLDLHTLRGHIGPVTAVAFSSDGKRVVTGSLDKTAKIWDVATGKAVATLKGHTGGINTVAFSPDNKRVVTASADNSAKLWDTTTGELQVTFTGHAFVKRSYSLDGISSVAFSPDGKWAITGGNDGAAIVWDAKTKRVIYSFAEANSVVNAVAFSPAGDQVVVVYAPRWEYPGDSKPGAFSGTKIWDAKTGALIHNIKAQGTKVNFLSRRTIAVSNEFETSFWNVKTAHKVTASEQNLPVVPQHKEFFLRLGFCSVGFSSDGKQAIAAYARRAEVLSADRVVCTLQGHTDFINAVAFSPNSKLVVTGSDDNTAKIWNVDDTGTSTILRRTNGGYEIVIF